MNSEQLAWRIRRHGIEMTHLSGGSHIGSILSVADIIAVLYTDVAKVDPKNPDWIDRDKVILSKGHAGAAIYAALAEKGFFSVEELKTHYANGSKLSGHVSHKGVPGVEFSTGSLGHGLSVGSGMAYGMKKDNRNNRVFVILGDGECDEGAVWEAALISNHFNLNNLIAIIDHNKMQSLDYVENTISLAPFSEKWKAFGWNVIDIDGHDHLQLKNAFDQAKSSKEKPTVIIANTIKGKGISFMENNILWHYRFPHEGEEYDTSLTELNGIKPEGIEDSYEVKKK
jgi:transketolase